MTKLKAAIIGLGQVGMLFDEETERRLSGEIWTHFSAYEKLVSKYDLVAAAEPDESKHSKAIHRNPGIRLFKDVDEMLDSIDIDVVSVCTPEHTHLPCLRPLIGRVKGIFLEKPLCMVEELDDARELVEKMRATRTCIKVNYYKRTEPLFLQALKAIDGERILHLIARYSGPFYAVGVHSLNLMVGVVRHLNLLNAFRHPHEEGEGYSAVFTFGKDCLCELIYCGARHRLIFELDIVTDRGKVLLDRNMSMLTLYRYKRSRRYKNYEELERVDYNTCESNNNRFVNTLEEIDYEIRNSRFSYDSMEDALLTQENMAAIVSNAS